MWQIRSAPRVMPDRIPDRRTIMTQRAQIPSSVASQATLGIPPGENLSASSELKDQFAAACFAVVRWPLPGSGSSLQRFELLASACREDVALGRLVEAHADAIAIIAELRGTGAASDAATGRRWGVWAAGPADSVRARRSSDGWRLCGLKNWCSGASLVTHVLVDAKTDVGQQLFAVDLADRAIHAQRPLWLTAGMARTDTRAVEFADAPAQPIGGVGSYIDRPGFWAGAMGVAACWHGATIRIGQTLWDERERLDVHGLVHLASISTALLQNQAFIERAARLLDGEPELHHPIMARALRGTVAANGSQVIERVGRALGPAPLVFNAHHAEAVLDLQVYLRQEHAERDLERLGADLSEREALWPL